MKLTAEQKAANKAARLASTAANAEKIKSGKGNEPLIALIENASLRIDEQLETLGDSHEGLADEMKGVKADLEKVIRETKSRKSGKTTEGMDTDKFSFAKLGKVFTTTRNFEAADNAEGVGYEIEVLVEAAKGYGSPLQKKDIISSLTGGSGGFALPMQIKEEIIAAARSESRLMGMGVRNDSLEGMSSFSVPMETTSAGGVGSGVIMTPGSVQESGAITVTRNGYKLANFTPRKLAMIIGTTNDFLRQGGTFVENYVRSAAAVDFKNQLERLAIYGRGQANSEPTGIINRSDLTAFTGTAVGTNGRLAKFKDFKDFEFDLAIANRLTDDAKFLTHPGVMRGPSNEYAVLASGGTAVPVFPTLAMASMKKLQELMGYDIRWTTNVGYVTQGSAATASSIIYGDFKNVWIPFWGPMEFVMTNIATVAGVSAYETDMSWMRFVQMYDVNIVAPDSLMAQKGFLTTAS